MGADVLAHGEGPHLVLAEDLGHGGVGLEELLVLRVLEVVLLDVGPQLLDALGPGRLLLADDGGELGAQLHGAGEAGSLGHGGGVEGRELRKRERRNSTVVGGGSAESDAETRTGWEGGKEGSEAKRGGGGGGKERWSQEGRREATPI